MHGAMSSMTQAVLLETSCPRPSCVQHASISEDFGFVEHVDCFVNDKYVAREGTLPNLLCPAPVPYQQQNLKKYEGELTVNFRNFGLGTRAPLQAFRSIFGLKPKPAQSERQDQGPVIAVIGCNGSGKSQFIYDITGRPEDQARICHSHVQGRSVFEKVRINVQDPSFPAPTITLIDTPGVDLNHPGFEQKVLDDLCIWLKRKNLRVDGLVYTHNISNMYEHTSEGRSPALFTSLPGLWNNDLGEAKKVIFLNTHWEQCLDGQELERMLMDGYWSKMHRKGSHMMRYESRSTGSRLEALAILKKLIQNG